ncbi:hypothetical protein [Actinomadura sp. KC216]|uniref:hypothetical protein n=1 Tax=Actinomadura sp. KC216 TaxID=2530370 RepID=UPI001404A997|nr:hypothetical protein [Actinomadura sp. KC216]
MSTLARQLNGAGVRLLPGGEPPAMIADLKSADLVTGWAWTTMVGPSGTGGSAEGR